VTDAGGAPPAEHPTRPPDGSLSWTSWPLRDQWPRSLAAPAAIVALTAAVHVSWRSAVFDAIAFALLCLSLVRYLLPVRFRADRDGFCARSLLSTERHTWGEFRGCRETRCGLALIGRDQRAEFAFPVPPARSDVVEYVRARIG
jgi:hypothetical protein